MSKPKVTQDKEEVVYSTGGKEAYREPVAVNPLTNDELWKRDIWYREIAALNQRAADHAKMSVMRDVTDKESDAT